jgi:hypothetical protein
LKTTLGVLTVCLLSTSTWAAPIQWAIADGGNDHWYEVVSAEGISWNAARSAALSMYYDGLQAHLATLTSEEELTFLDGVIQDQGLGEMYVGGYQNPSNEPDPKAGWTWVNGEGWFPGYDNYGLGADPNVPFAHWNGNEPNDAYGTASEQWLGVGWAARSFNDEGNVANIDGYIVEYDPTTISDVPDTSVTAPLLGGALALLMMVYRRIRK